MSDRSKLQLEFEILTLTNNIETLKKLGENTADHQVWLQDCRAKYQSLKLAEVEEKQE